VLDASWGKLRFMLTYKAARNNATLVVVDRFFASTRLCRECGRLNRDLRLADRQWICQCGVRHERDLNAARNIDHEGLRLYHLNVAAGLAETQNAGGDWVGSLETGGAGR
jgi:putative transposase